jgi:hypothetical protein
MSRLDSVQDEGKSNPEPIHINGDQRPTKGGEEQNNLEKQTSPYDKAHHDNSHAERAREKEEAQEKIQEKKDGSKKDESKKEGSAEEQPAGGYDATPVPRAPPGWTVKITFHRATNLPMADISSMSSDPYVLAQINTAMPKRHKEDPLLRMRTPTIRRNTDPEWNFEWIVGNIPSSGFKLKARVYDEDPNDHDDRLGNVHIPIHEINENWPGIQEQPYKIMKRAGSKRAYAIRTVAACMSKAKHMHADLFVSIELMGRTQIPSGGHVFTIGPQWWIRHQAPMLGRIAGRKEPDDNKNETEKEKSKTERYNFQANQIQFRGPVPDELYHRFVEFRPFVKQMFTSSGVRGWVLSKALHHQHARVYNFDRTTKWGHFPQGPCKEMTQAFLDLVHYDEGGRIFTYVLSLDALFRFTETGKEFGIDMLSKHTMHSDVSVYIAFSGEFFIRRLKYKNKPPPPDAADTGSISSEDPDLEHHHDGANESHPPNDLSNGPPNDEPPKDPAHYQLVIDNDSGTYRPNADMLPLLKKFLAANLPGLHIQTLDSQKDAEKMSRMKKAQRDRKKKEGDQIVYAQADASSISSSDEEELDALEQTAQEEEAEERTPGLAHQLKQDAGLLGKSRLEHVKRNLPGHSRGE